MKPNKYPRPSKDAFWVHSEAFLEAANASHKILRSPCYVGLISIPTVFLYLRSTELCLKSFLPESDYTDSNLMRCLGHRLTLLIDEIDKLGVLSKMKMIREDFKIIDDLSESYSSKLIEYSPRYLELLDLDSLSCFVNNYISTSRDYNERI